MHTGFCCGCVRNDARDRVDLEAGRLRHESESAHVCDERVCEVAASLEDEPMVRVVYDHVESSQDGIADESCRIAGCCSTDTRLAERGDGSAQHVRAERQ